MKNCVSTISFLIGTLNGKYAWYLMLYSPLIISSKAICDVIYSINETDASIFSSDKLLGIASIKIPISEYPPSFEKEIAPTSNGSPSFQISVIPHGPWISKATSCSLKASITSNPEWFSQPSWAYEPSSFI